MLAVGAGEGGGTAVSGAGLGDWLSSGLEVAFAVGLVVDVGLPVGLAEALGVGLGLLVGFGLLVGLGLGGAKTRVAIEVPNKVSPL